MHPDDAVLWLGDFNRRHPIWESEDNRHRNSSEDDIKPLLDLTGQRLDYILDMMKARNHNLHITLKCILRHTGIEGDQLADTQAKKSITEGSSDVQNLPELLKAPATQQIHNQMCTCKVKLRGNHST